MKHIGLLFVFLYVPIPSYAQAQAPYQESGNPSQTNAQVPNPATSISPDTAAISGPDEKQASYQNPKATDKPSGDDPITWFTGALVCVGIAQCLIYWRQAHLMRLAIEQSRKSSEVQLRAYISIDTQATDAGSVQQFNEALAENIFLTFVENTGQTPAYDVRCHSTWTIFPGEDVQWPENVRFKTVEEMDVGTTKGSSSVIGAGHRCAFRCNTTSQRDGTTLTAALIRATAGALTVYIYGTITYRDAFSPTIRQTEFCARSFKRTVGFPVAGTMIGFAGYNQHTAAT